ncbi:MAG: PaaI family thioesterase [Proteobacteria bacterium]|nr:PaaI family thioesterase [Pseudomonadota bacterium]
MERTPAPDWIVHDGPDAHCFGCGHRNPHGLKLAFRPCGEGAVESFYTAPAHHAGAPGVVHGGIQATLLDEILGMAVHGALDDRNLSIVTVDFNLRYRRPAPTETRLHLRGRLLRREGRDFFVEGEIASEDGAVLTTAEARWRALER